MHIANRHQGETLQEADLLRRLGIVPRIAVDDIVRHPRFAEARKTYLDGFLDVYGGDPFLVRLLVESGRVLVYLVVVTLEAAHDPQRPETWLTIGLLKRTMSLFGLASERHIDDLIARLCAVGFMESHPSPRDRRMRILSPTEQLRAHDRDWLVAHYAPLTALYPEHGYEPVMRRDPDFQARHRRIAVTLLPLAAEFYLSEPDMLLFLNRAGGHMVIASLLRTAMAADHRHAVLPYADIGDRFGISRTHVRKLMVDAEAAGLVRLHGRGGRDVEVLPRLWASHDRGLASGMYLNDLVYVAATRRPGDAVTTPAAD
jgi:hypothetical protein